MGGARHCISIERIAEMNSKMSLKNTLLGAALIAGATTLVIAPMAVSAAETGASPRAAALGKTPNRFANRDGADNYADLARLELAGEATAKRNLSAWNKGAKRVLSSPAVSAERAEFARLELAGEAAPNRPFRASSKVPNRARHTR